MSLIKKDKNIFNIFRKKEIKPVMSQKELDKLGIKSYSDENEATLGGIFIYIILCIGIFFGVRYVYAPYSTTSSLMAFNIIVPCIAVIIYWIMQFTKEDNQEDFKEGLGLVNAEFESDEDEEDEEDDEE